MDGWCADAVAGIGIGKHAAARCVVDGTDSDIRADGRIQRLRLYSGVRKQVLRVGTVSFTFLFAAHRPAASLVAAFPRVSDTGGATGIPSHLLQLPQYYRKALYRAFLLDPPACAVGEPASRRYSGETKFPFILQNLHRYFLYLAILFLVFLWKDVVLAFNFDGHFGIGVGTLVLLLNVCLLSSYTLSCHSLRHLAGGKLDCFSCATFGKPRFTAWRGLTFLNERHMWFAWCSLISVGCADLYIRLVSCGAIHDLRIL
jgi:hypothetical protein